MSETIRLYTTEELAHILYDEENPIGCYSWLGIGTEGRAAYVKRLEDSWQQRNVARQLAHALELTGGQGCNGWLVTRDKDNNTSPQEIQFIALNKQMNNLQEYLTHNKKLI